MKPPPRIRRQQFVNTVFICGLGLAIAVGLYFRFVGDDPLPYGLSVVAESQPPNTQVDLESASKAPKPHVRSSYSPKAIGDDAKSRMEYELMRLRDPRTGRIPANIRSKEMEFAATLPNAEEFFGKSGGPAAEQWTLRGPNNVGGRTRALAIDLDFNGGNNRRLLAGGISGGMHYSTDDGQTWTLATGLNDHASVTTVVQDPSNKSVWYYGTGESLGNSAGGAGAGYDGIGIFKSTNGGQSWTHLPGSNGGDPLSFDHVADRVWTLDTHPSNGTVYAAVYGLITRSTNGGTNWEAVLGDGPPYSQATDVHVATDGDVYAALGRNGSGKTEYGVFKSTTGASGSFVNISPPGLASDPYRIVLGSAPSDPSTLYALVQTTQAGEKAGDHQLFRYNEGNNSWQNLSANLPNEAGVDGNASFSTQGGYDQVVVVHPSNANVVFIGGTNLYRSDNGGQSFVRVGGYAGPSNYAGREGHHSDQHALVFYPNNTSTALSGSDGGVSRSTNILSANPTWTYINTGYVTSQFYGVGVDPTAGSPLLIGGLQDNGTWGTEDNNGQASWFELFSGDGGYSNVAPGGSMLTVTSQLGNMYRITPPNNYSNIAPAGASNYQFIVPNQLDPNDGNVLFVAEAGGVWRNSNLSGIPQGNQDPTSLNWTFLSGSAQSGHSTTMLAVPKAPANRVFFGTTDYQTSSRLIRVDNASGNGAGVNVMPPIQTQGFPAFPADLAANPNDGNELVAVFSNYGIESIWHSTNAGNSWTNVGGNLGGQNGPSIRSVVIVPTNSGKVVLVGTSTGVYSTSSLSGGSTNWALEGASVIGNVVINQLKLRYSDATVTVATHGRGVYQAKVSGGGSGGAQIAADRNSLGIDVLNPSNSGSTTFTISNPGSASLTYTIGATGSAAPEQPAEVNTRVHLDEGDTQAKEWARVIGDRRQTAESQDRQAPSLASRSTLKSMTPAIYGPTTGSDPGVLKTRSASGDFLFNDDGNETADQYVGFGDGFTAFQWYNRFAAPTGGFRLESVLVNMRTESVGSTTLFMIVTDPQGNEFVSGSATLEASPAGKWYELAFTPVQLNGGQIIDVEFVASASIGFPAGADFNGTVTGNSYFFDGFSYTGLSTQPNFANGAFLIRAQGTGPQTQNNPPVANIQVSKQNANVNETINFNGSGSTDSDGSITQYLWNFGDGASANQANVSHAYSNAGNYTVTLMVTDNNGATNQASTGVTITSSEPSRLTVSPSSGTLNAGQSATITVSYDASGLALGSYNGTVTVNTSVGNLTLPVTIGVTSVGVEDEVYSRDGFALHANYPNPFRDQTRIPYQLGAAGHITLAVYDLTGRVVRRLVDADQPAGEHEVLWDSYDDSGRLVASGVYLVRLEATRHAGESAIKQSLKITVRR